MNSIICFFYVMIKIFLKHQNLSLIYLQAAWTLKTRALTGQVYVDEVDVDEEGIAEMVMDDNTIAQVSRPGTSLKQPGTGRGAPSQGVRWDVICSSLSRFILEDIHYCYLIFYFLYLGLCLSLAALCQDLSGPAHREGDRARWRRPSWLPALPTQPARSPVPLGATSDSEQWVFVCNHWNIWSRFWFMNLLCNIL